MRNAYIGLVLVLCALSMGADEEASKIHSASAKSAIEKRDGLVKRAYQEYLAKVVVAERQLVVALDQSLREAMAKSDLDEATAINALKKATTDRLAGEQAGNPVARIAGTRWKWSSTPTMLTFGNDGTFNRSIVGGVGHWEAINENTILVHEANNNVFEVTLSNDFEHSLWVQIGGNKEINYATKVSMSH